MVLAWPCASASATASAAPDAGRHLGGRPAREHRGERGGRSGTNGRDIDPGQRRRQQADIGEHRIAPADVRIVIEHRHAIGREQPAQAVALARGRLADGDKAFADLPRQAGGAHRVERRDGLHQRLAGAARFRDRHEARGGERRAGKQQRVAVGIEIVHEVQARPVGQGPDARHRMAAELRQGLPAEARAAGAEKHHVGGALGEALAGGADPGEVVAFLRETQQRQLAVGVAAFQPVERAGRARERVVVCLCVEAVRTDALRAGAVDRLNERHGGRRKQLRRPCGRCLPDP
jgi:hypothetical protein